MLEVRDLTVGYGHAVAVSSVSLAVPPGSIVAVIGANGAGKTTLMRGLMGQVKPRGGRVIYSGKDITGSKPHLLARKGMTIVPQDRGTLFPLTVDENLVVAADRLPKSHRTRECRKVYDMFPVLWERKEIKAGHLSGGEQQMLAFGRAVVAQPRLLLLDEPSTGLSPLMTTAIMGAIKQLRDEKSITVLVVEQNVPAVLGVAEYGYVLSGGRLVREGAAAELQNDPRVQAAFLGL